MRANFLLLAGTLVVAACGRTSSSTSASPQRRVMDVYLLAGQSNMAGRGVVEPQDKINESRVLMLDRALTWVPAVDPVHYDKPIAGVGPGRSFGLAIAARDLDARVGLVPAAVGGSPISSWEPGALDRATNTHPYDDALVRARVALKDGTLRGILWHQGESDATSELSVRYADKLRALIARFRSDLGAPNVPFIIGQLGRFPGKPWTDAQRRVDSAQRAIAATVSNVAYVSSDELRDKGDTLHFDAAAAREFGRRYAKAFIEILEKACHHEPSGEGSRSSVVGNNEIPRCARDDREARLQRPTIAEQRDPGRGGNGVDPQPEPYTPPAEIERRLREAPEGTVSDVAYFSSKIYGLKFRYRIYVPAQYKPGHAAALMVFQDARSVYLGLMKTPQVFDNLIHAGEMPVTIGLFLDPGTANGEYVQANDRELRSMEYDSMDDKYSRFLIDEIIPAVVQSRYDVVDGGWGIGGQSSGGIAAFTAGWLHPERFTNILTQNGSFTNIRGGDAYPSLVRSQPVRPLRVYLLSGTNDLNNQFGSWLEANKALATALDERGYAYRFRPGAGGHFPPVQAQADFANALRWLWRGYSLRSYPPG